jgi:CheY-like chemotaxis protein
MLPMPSRIYHSLLMINLLIIVDDWEALEVYENILGAHFKIHSSPFGSEGIRLAQEWSSHEPLGRVLIDLTFEDMHASEACEQLRKDPRTQKIPLTVILNEGEELLELPGRFPQAGDQVYQRPFPFEQLLDDLKKSI